MKKVLAWAVVLALVLSSFTMAFAADAPNSSQFKDADQIQYTEAVDVMVALGVINGFPDGTFGPQKTVERGQMAKMIAVIMNGGEDVGDQYKSACPFKDSQNHWAAGYIAYCASEHIIDGRSADVFDPGATVTGTEVAKMALTSLGYDSKIQGYTGETWAANVLKDAKKNELFKGLDKSFVPGDPCSREAAAQILFNMLKAVMVQYNNNTSISVGDNTEVVVSSKAEQIDNPNDGNDNKLNLYEEVFGESSDATLVSLPSKGDEFGRPGHSWTVEDENLGPYTDAADYEFIAEDTAMDKAIEAYDEDLASELKDAKVTPTVKVNGTTGTLAVGDKVELYYDKQKKTCDAIVSQYKPYQISEVSTDVKKKDADKGVTAYVTFADLGKFNDTAITGFDANTYKKDAIIAVAANGKKILDSYVMEELASGEITKINNTSKAVTIDGKDYDKATNYKKFGEADLAVEGEFTLYDYNGYYLASLQTKKPESKVFYGVVVDKKSENGEWESEQGASNATVTLKIFTTEGEFEPIAISKDFDKTKVPAKDTLIAYTLNDDGEIATINTTPTGSWAAQKMGTNGVIEGKAVSEDVVVFFKKTEENKDPEYMTYGFSDLEKAESITASYFMEEGKVVVAQLGAPIESKETILGFVTDKAEYTVSGGTQADVSVLVDGKPDTFKTVVAKAAGDYKIEDKPVGTLMTFEKNGEGALKKAEAAKTNPVTKIETTIPDGKVANTMDVTVDGKDNNSLDILAGKDDYNYQSVVDADFYFINDEGKIEVSSYDSIKAGDLATLYQTDAKSTSWNIVVFKAAPEKVTFTNGKNSYGMLNDDASSLGDVTVAQDGKDVSLTGTVPYSTGNTAFSAIEAEQSGNYVALVMKINGEISDSATLKASANPATFKVKDALDTGKSDEITLVLIVSGGQATVTFDWDGTGSEAPVTYTIDCSELELTPAPTPAPAGN